MQPKHVRFLDGVRGFAAAYVVLHHASINLPSTYTDGAWSRGLQRVFAYGHYSVDVFIVLSGYCLALPFVSSVRRLEPSEFFVRRALRILPTYYVAALISLLLVATCVGRKTGTNWDVSIPVTRWDLVSHFLLVHDWSAGTTNKLNHAFWSIGVEWKLYFLFPALLWMRRRWGMPRAAALATFAGYSFWLVLWAERWLNPSPWGSSVYYVGLFAMGMAAAELGVRRPRDGRARHELSAFVAASLLLVAVSSSALLHLPRPVPLQIASFFVGLWTSALLVALERRALPFLARTFETRPAVWLGKMGYSIYLIHAPVLQLVYQYVIRPLDLPYALAMPVMLVLSLTASVAAATLLYRFVELPFHTLSRSVSVRFWPAPEGPPSVTSPRGEPETRML
ncbi:MAG TPA: acyltransferase [Polyangiaceae bacterium]|nr:acyltransferase [Polyangiaceae bacterium]